MDESVRQRQPPPPTPMSYTHHRSLTYFTQQALRAGYSVPPPPPASHTDEELGIPQQRFQNYREMREAIMIEIEKEKRRSLEIEKERELLLLPSRSNCELIGASISQPVPPLSACGLIGDPIPPRDDGMSLEEKLARNCEEKRLVEKAAAVRRWQYDG